MWVNISHFNASIAIVCSLAECEPAEILPNTWADLPLLIAVEDFSYQLCDILDEYLRSVFTCMFEIRKHINLSHWSNGT